MGQQLSQNFDNIEQTFTLDCWKVHSAKHKVTNEIVSLWILDQDLLTEKFPNKTDQNTYLDICLSCIQNIRKLRHPHVLKIVDVVDKKPSIAFSSEPVSSYLNSKSEKLHPMDVAYISLQIAEVLGFLNQDARMGYLNLTPSSVLLNEELSVKLFHFEFISQVNSNGQCQVSQYLSQPSLFSDTMYKAPEILSGKDVTPQADVFSFGLFLYQAFSGKNLYQTNNPQEIVGSIPRLTSAISGVPTDFRPLIQNCLNLQPSLRPSFSQIQQNEAYSSVQLKSLKYLDMILTKQPQDKFKFYKGLATKINDFSPNILKIKILPTLLAECKNEVRFAPILLGSIFTITKDFSIPEFMSKIWNKISFLTTVTDPPEILVALLQNIKIILEKIDKPMHKDYVYPIIFTALQTSNSRLHKECLNRIPSIIDEMNENSVRSLILPRLIDLCINTPDSNIAAASINCVAKCLPKIDNDSFTNDFIPKIALVWNRFHNPSIGASIVTVIESLHASNDVLLSKAVPIASEILGGHILNGNDKSRLCDWIISTVTHFKNQKENNFNSQTSQASNVIDTDNPFADSSKLSTPKVSKNDPIVLDVFGDNSKSSSNKKDDPIVFDVFGDSLKPTTSRIEQKPIQSNTGFQSSKPNTDIFSNISNSSVPSNTTQKPMTLGDLSSQTQKSNKDIGFNDFTFSMNQNTTQNNSFNTANSSNTFFNSSSNSSNTFNSSNFTSSNFNSSNNFATYNNSNTMNSFQPTNGSFNVPNNNLGNFSSSNQPFGNQFTNNRTPSNQQSSPDNFFIF